MRALALGVLSFLPALGPGPARAEEAPAPRVERPAEEARQRVGHHLHHADALARHFERVLAEDCPRFESAPAWRAYLDGEVDRVVTLIAHVAQAWLEARQTGDDDVRRAAKAPRRRLGQARALVDKLQACAEDHGDGLPAWALWRRIERDVPRRQAEIALPR